MRFQKFQGEPPPKGRAWVTPIGRMLAAGGPSQAEPQRPPAAAEATLREPADGTLVEAESRVEASGESGTPTQPG